MRDQMAHRSNKVFYAININLQSRPTVSFQPGSSIESNQNLQSLIVSRKRSGLGCLDIEIL